MAGLDAKMTIIPVLNLSEKFELWGSGKPQEFARMLQKNLQQHNILTSNHRIGGLDAWFDIRHQTMGNGNPDVSIRAGLSQFKGQANSTILVILPSRRQELYTNVNKIGDVDLGLRTICTRRDQIDKQRNHGNFCGNIALKYQVKGEGETHSVTELLDVALNDCIIIGADVTHPGRGAVNGCPSVAAVVGSIGPNHMTYPGELRLQPSRQEVSCTIFPSWKYLSLTDSR